MKKKGFTLVEMLAVITILTIIMIITFPNFSSLTQTTKSKYEATTRVLLTTAASMYVSNNLNDIESDIASAGTTGYCIPVGKLIAYEYLDSDLKDKDGNPISLNQCIRVKLSTVDGKKKYEYSILNTSDVASGDFMPPILQLVKKGNVECSTTMTLSFEEFKNTCTVYSIDDGTSVDITNSPASNISKDNKIFLQYSSTDSSGNKSVPLKIQLITQE